MLRMYQRGDTIIEVLLAVTVFSLVSVGTMMVMNQGTSSAQRALEITLVKEQIDSQAEALRAAQQAYAVDKTSDEGSTWTQITNINSGNGTGSVPPASGNQCPDNYSGTSVFAMNGRTAGIIQGAQLLGAGATNAPPYSQVTYNNDDSAQNVYGLWIESGKSSGAPLAYDFTIHACWYSVGTNKPMELQTVVRLYDPAS